jgi:hypothetical protein
MDIFYLFTNINFQKGFLLVACVILVIVILNVAYKFSKEDALGMTRPIIAPCPDFWDLSGGYCINTNGQNIGFEPSGPDTENSIWRLSQECSVKDPYTLAPIKCSDSNLRTIPIGTMSHKAKNKLVGGEIKNGVVQNIRKKRSKMSRKDWANKYGFAWDGLNTKW